MISGFATGLARDPQGEEATYGMNGDRKSTQGEVPIVSSGSTPESA
jgi:hypothetical protein